MLVLPGGTDKHKLFILSFLYIFLSQESTKISNMQLENLHQMFNT